MHIDNAMISPKLLFEEGVGVGFGGTVPPSAIKSQDYTGIPPILPELNAVCNAQNWSPAAVLLGCVVVEMEPDIITLFWAWRLRLSILLKLELKSNVFTDMIWMFV